MRELIVIDAETAEKLLAAAGFTVDSTRSEIHHTTDNTVYPGRWLADDIRSPIFHLQEALKSIKTSR
jgi:hypothetical protein